MVYQRTSFASPLEEILRWWQHWEIPKRYKSVGVTTCHLYTMLTYTFYYYLPQETFIFVSISSVSSAFAKDHFWEQKCGHSAVHLACLIPAALEVWSRPTYNNELLYILPYILNGTDNITMFCNNLYWQLVHTTQYPSESL